MICSYVPRNTIRYKYYELCDRWVCIRAYARVRDFWHKGTDLRTRWYDLISMVGWFSRYFGCFVEKLMKYLNYIL